MVKVTREFLRSHSKVIFVFGDNLAHKGHGGAAELRDEANTYGFITKKYPDNKDSSFYTPNEYREIFATEIQRLIRVIKLNRHKLFLISKIGSGLANRYGIWEIVIEPQITEALREFSNVIFLWIGENNEWTLFSGTIEVTVEAKSKEEAEEMLEAFAEQIISQNPYVYKTKYTMPEEK